MTSSIGTVFHTVRYLRPVQVYRRLYRPRPSLPIVLDVSVREPLGTWTQPISRPSNQIANNRFRFLNQEHTIESWNDEELPKLWLYNLHYFDYPTADLIERWIRENPTGMGNGWEPYPLSIRIVNWIKWAITHAPINQAVLNSLQLQSEYLSQSLEYHLGGNHLLANAVALTIAGLHFNGEPAQRWTQLGTNLLAGELDEQILSDGGHYERSPMYQAVLLESLLDLINVSQTLNPLLEVNRCSWRKCAGNMLGWLLKMTHPDGQIAFFNDCAFDVAPEPSELLAYASRLGIEPPESPLSSSGYRRLSADETLALFDAGPVGPDHQPGHAHADTLSFELSHRGRRVLVNSGTSTYEKGLDRQWQRGTAAHNTVRIDRLDQSEVWSAFRVARRAFPFDIRSDGKSFAEAAHDGYSRLSDPVVHRRRLEISRTEVIVTDQIEGRGRHIIELFFHFHPSAQPNIALDPKLTKDVKPSHWYPQFNTSVPNTTVVGTWTGETPVQFKTVIPLS